MSEKLLFTRAEAAALLSISLRTLDHLHARKEIRVRRVGRKILIPRAELERFTRNDHPGRTVALSNDARANE
jgi:excisionase family DNA binding protein